MEITTWVFHWPIRSEQSPRKGTCLACYHYVIALTDSDVPFDSISSAKHWEQSLSPTDKARPAARPLLSPSSSLLASCPPTTTSKGVFRPAFAHGSPPAAGPQNSDDMVNVTYDGCKSLSLSHPCLCPHHSPTAGSLVWFDPDTQQNVVYNLGDIAWVLASTALVWIMIPGVGFFYSGLLRRKNALSMIWLSMMVLAVVSFQVSLLSVCPLSRPSI